uniref:ATP receptor n=1 Tax=Macrostomum lignano TaxID=282301 RepID=A0A1I8FR34_9PLAT
QIWQGERALRFGELRAEAANAAVWWYLREPGVTTTTPISRPSAIASGTWPTGQCRPDEQRLLRHHQRGHHQEREPDTCEEDKDNRWHASCKSDADCQKGHVHMLGWGVKTGRCVRSSREANLTICEIYGWWPHREGISCRWEMTLFTPAIALVLMTHVKNFTVLIKNSVEFPKFGVKRRNILTKMTNRYLKTCNYRRPNHPEDRTAPSSSWATSSNTDRPSARRQPSRSGSLGCNFDYDEEHCKPEYKFRNLEDGKVGQGWNFRHAYHYVEDGIHKRTLVKAFGIQFFISVTGRGGKFDILNFMNLRNPGWLCSRWLRCCGDIIVLNIMRKKKISTGKIDKFGACWCLAGAGRPRHGPRLRAGDRTSGVGDSRRLPGRPPAAVRPVRLGLRVDGIGRRELKAEARANARRPMRRPRRCDRAALPAAAAAPAGGSSGRPSEDL